MLLVIRKIQVKNQVNISCHQICKSYLVWQFQFLARILNTETFSTLLEGLYIRQPFWRTVWQYFLKLNVCIIYNPALLLLGEFLERFFHDKSGDMYMNIHLTLEKHGFELHGPFTHFFPPTKYILYFYKIFGCWNQRGQLYFKGTLFIIARNWKQLKSQWAREWINKLEYIYTVE